MDLKLLVNVIFLTISNASVINSDANNITEVIIPDSVFNGVYSECFLHLSYSCLQKKTLLYLKELNNLSEVSVIGDYVKFVKINKSDDEEAHPDEMKTGETEELAFMIDKAIDNFFDNHVLKFYAMGRNISMPRNVEGFVGRKKRRGGGGGGGGHGGGHDGGGGGHDDGGKKKMMMMAMMCMKMKLMMMVPAMMGMMGMMSFKGMMFSMMSFMISKMMLLMKILEKKGGGSLGGGGGGGGLDGGWAAGGAGGGAWMPAGGQDYAGGGGGGGYDANGQWQSRSIVENLENYKTIENDPVITFVRPIDTMKWKKDTQGNEKWKSKTMKMKPAETVIKPEDKPQWRSRSIDETFNPVIENKPEISFVKRTIRFNNKVEREKDKNKSPVLVYKKSNVNFDFNDPDYNVGFDNHYDKENTNPRSKREVKSIKQETLDLNDNKHVSQTSDKKENMNKHYNINKIGKYVESKPRQRRGVIDLLQNSYIYWVNQILGLNNNRRTTPQRYKIVNGVKYVYYPYKLQKLKMPKGIPMTQNEDLKPLVAVEEFNKGEIVDGGVDGIESRMIQKKLKKMKDTVNDTMEDNPWE